MNRKIGQGSLQAFMRKGMKEAQQIVVAFPDSVNANTPNEPGELWSTTTQGASQQAGISQPVSISDTNSPMGFDAMNAGSPEQQPEVETPDFDPGECIVDSMIDHARDMAPEPEMEQEMEMDQ